MENIINTLVVTTPAALHALAPFLAGGAGVAIVLQLIKNIFSFADAKKFFVFLNGFFSFALVVADAVISSGASNPQLFGVRTATVMGFAMVVHRFLVSPVYNSISNQLGSLVSDANSYRASLTPTSPVSAAPTVNTPSNGLAIQQTQPLQPTQHDDSASSTFQP